PGRKVKERCAGAAMLDAAIIALALAGAGWLLLPPRGDRRGWLATALFLLWGALMLIGWRRGVLAGFEGWLALLALMAALAGLLVVWSAVNLKRQGPHED